MANRNVYECDRCDCNINEEGCSVVFYLVAGNVNGSGEIPTDELNEFQKLMLQLPVSRIEWCSKCFAEVFKVSKSEIERLKALVGGKPLPQLPGHDH